MLTDIAPDNITRKFHSRLDPRTKILITLFLLSIFLASGAVSMEILGVSYFDYSFITSADAGSKINKAAVIIIVLTNNPYVYRAG
ncbi:MAG: hypothetical protein ACLRXQ_09325 [Phascolarctobacterium faecium]